MTLTHNHLPLHTIAKLGTLKHHCWMGTLQLLDGLKLLPAKFSYLDSYLVQSFDRIRDICETRGTCDTEEITNTWELIQVSSGLMTDTYRVWDLEQFDTSLEFVYKSKRQRVWERYSKGPSRSESKFKEVNKIQRSNSKK